jgi:hypothetical protein
MKKIRTQGFSAVEIILGVVVIAAIIGIGWYVYNANQAKSNTQQRPRRQKLNTLPLQNGALRFR